MMINLTNMPILAPLNAEEIWDLVERSEIKTFYDNAVIVQKGTPIKLLCIIISGAVIRNKNKNGQKSIQYLEGDSFGEESLIFQRPSEEDYVSIGEGTKIATIWGC